jgi:hypothetical protein
MKSAVFLTAINRSVMLVVLKDRHTKYNKMRCVVVFIRQEILDWTEK